METGTETFPGGKMSACSSVSASSADARKKGSQGVGAPDVSQSRPSSSCSFLFFKVDMLSHFFGSMKHYF